MEVWVGLVASSGEHHETMTQESAESDLLTALPLWAEFSHNLRGSSLSLIFNSLNLGIVIFLASLLFFTFPPEATGCIAYGLGRASRTQSCLFSFISAVSLLYTESSYDSFKCGIIKNEMLRSQMVLIRDETTTKVPVFREISFMAYLVFLCCARCSGVKLPLLQVP